jgi:PDZ domain
MRPSEKIAGEALILLYALFLALHSGVAGAQDLSPSETLLPSATTEIPSGVISDTGQAATAQDIAPSGGANSGPGFSNEPMPPAELRQERQDLHDFLEEEPATSSLGMVLQEAHRGVDGSGEVLGLLVVEVLPGTPAARAGLRGLHTGVKDTLSGVAFAAAMVFPPAILAAAVISGTRIGESYDLIIGVDSDRVTSFLDFSDRVSRARPGELVYLNISRNGKRILCPLSVPVSFASGEP